MRVCGKHPKSVKMHLGRNSSEVRGSRHKGHVWKQSAHDSQDQWQTVVVDAAGVGAGVTQIGLCFLSGVVGDSQSYIG